jgi:hypothetical protein
MDQVSAVLPVAPAARRVGVRGQPVGIDSAASQVNAAASWLAQALWRCRCRKLRPRWSGCVVVFVEDAVESIMPLDVEVVESRACGDRWW